MIALGGAATSVAPAAQTVPAAFEQPGTQPGEVSIYSADCDTCHMNTPNPELEPSRGWYGSMMAHSARDPLFWAALAIAEQDLMPGNDPDQRGGAGDLCLRCHMPGGWLQERSTPTDGSALAATDTRGVECEHCHLMVDPDPTTNVSGTVEEQSAPYEAFDSSTGEGYYGSGQYVINSAGGRLGPYADGDAQAPHSTLGSSFHRQGELCGTCHDVSNPAVGDLAHNHGAQVPLAAGTFSGSLSSPVQDKAAFNNPPYRYGAVERTFSEWVASALDTLRVNDYPSLPAGLKVAGGALDVAYHRAYDARSDADYADGTPRYFTCQTCHMSASTGLGCRNFGVPVRDDLPRHDLTGSGYWIPDAILFQDDRGTLRFGGGIDPATRDAMADGQQRAVAMLRSAASLGLTQVGGQLAVRVTNLTGHKLISGYPEGRRMWLNVRWLDGGGGVIGEEGAYGTLGMLPAPGGPYPIESLLDPDGTVVYEAKPGLDQEWAAQLVGAGYPPGLTLSYDRLTGAVEHTLGELAAEAPGTAFPTFHFVLNNVITKDTRIPPYGFDHDQGLERSALPVPAAQFGDPGPGGTYEHWHDASFSIPPGAATAEVRLFYQQTSWEYIQFLWLQNDGLSSFLGQEGLHMLQAWLGTGMSPPLEMTSASLALGPAAGVPGEASPPDVPSQQMRASYDPGTGRVDVTYTPACDASDHTIYYGSLAQVSTYGYSGAACGAGISGSASFDPGPSSVFFLIVANDGVEEGSYGLDADDGERPEDLATAGCDLPQNLGGVVCQ